MLKLIKNATIVNEGKRFFGSVLIENDRIKKIITGNADDIKADIVFDAEGILLLPGVIDEHVHFREPGLTHKADMQSESCAAVAGGVTSFMDMPNVVPQTTTLETLKQKQAIAAQKSMANYAFYLGYNQENLSEIKKLNPKETCGIKLFLGSSTGNMLMDKTRLIEDLFSETTLPIAVHSENEALIQANVAHFKAIYKNNIPISCHPLIRSEEACYKATAEILELAQRHNAKLHILHISTAKELSLFDDEANIEKKRVTAETCPQYLWFTDKDYDTLGTRIKCNPAIKTAQDRDALLQAMANGKIDTIATDHAPHLLDEKKGDCMHAVSGMPLIQFSLLAMLQLTKNNLFGVEDVVKKMCHNPALIYGVQHRGFIREGYFADLVLVNPGKQQCVDKNAILSTCGWSPFEGTKFDFTISKTFVNGHLAFNNGRLDESKKGRSLIFNH